MGVLVFHLELAAMSGLLVLLYATRPKLGLAPLYMAVGLLAGFALIGSRLHVIVPEIGGGHVRYASAGYLPLMLGSIALVYTLEGTREARRMALAMVAIKALLNVLKTLLSLRIATQPELVETYARGPWVRVGLTSSVVSTVAILGAALTTVVVYQALLNLGRRMPTVLALIGAMVAAMLADGVLYNGLLGRISKLDAHMTSKFTAGFAVATPMAGYIAYRLRRVPHDVKQGVLDRGAFDILDLRMQLRSMRAQLSQSEAEFAHLKGVFGRYVAPDVVEEILADTSQLELGGEVRDVSILFSDIRGYSTLSEQLSPQQTIELLNRYFGAMSQHIDRHRGTIIEFEGDAILAVFGAPLGQADHADRALQTAIDMQRDMARLNAEFEADGTSKQWRPLGLDGFRIRIGLHSGSVVAGNVGSETRTKYAVIGDTVNTAARVEQLNKRLGCWLLCTKALVAALQRPHPAELLPLGAFEVRGRKEPVDVYTLAEFAPADVQQRTRS